MNVTHILTGLAVGIAMGLVGWRLAPRWMSKSPGPKAGYVLIGVSAALGGLLAQSHGIGAYFWPQAIFLGVLTLAALVDLYDRIIPNELVLFGLAVGLVSTLVLPRTGWTVLEGLGGGAAGFGLLFALAVAVRGGMGYGDVKLAAVIGVFLGFPWVFMGLTLGFLTGGLIAVMLMVLRKVGRRDMIPFGPFLALGAALTALYGQAIWTWYISL